VGEGSFSDILASIDWTIENKERYKIKVLVLPFGAESIVPHKQDPLCAACEKAWNAGLIVIAAAGNRGGHTGSITTPGVCPSIITVGCCECKSSNIRDFIIPDFSGRGGKGENGVKPELIAPGVNITSLSSDKGFIPSKGRTPSLRPLETPYCTMTGTSVSTAVAAGCAALVIEKIPTISGKDLKGMLKLSCQTLNEPKTSQGYGVINIAKLLNEK
jgi:serine protease AprX